MDKIEAYEEVAQLFDYLAQNRALKGYGVHTPAKIIRRALYENGLPPDAVTLETLVERAKLNTEHCAQDPNPYALIKKVLVDKKNTPSPKK